MGVVHVDVQQPRSVVVLPNELDGALRSPSGLVQRGGHAVLALAERVEVASLFLHPVSIVMTFFPVVARGVTEFPVTEAIIDAWLGSFAGALQMKFSHQAAVVACIRNQPGDHRGPGRKSVVPIAGTVHAARVEPAHEARPAWRADRALAESVSKGHAFSNKPIDVGGVYVRIANRTNSIKPLLVGTDLKDIRPTCFRIHEGSSAPCVST